MKVRTLVAMCLAIALVIVSGCSGPSTYAPPAPDTPGLKRIAVAQIAQETNSFSAVLTDIRQFESRGLLYGDEILTELADSKTAIAGFLSAVADHGNDTVEVVPILRAFAVAGGPLENEVYERFKQELVEGLAESGPIDGVYLVLHGAMGAEGLRDPEGDLLAAVREVVGAETPVGISHDLHANITARRVELADFIVGYKTNPHRDHFDTGYRSGEILVRTVLGEIEPVMAIRKLPMLVGGGMEIDLLPPMRGIFKWMKKAEKPEEVLNLSNFMVHIWLDDEELGWTTVAVTDGDPGLARELADELAMQNWGVKDVLMPSRLTADEAVAAAKEKGFARFFGPLIACDSADAVGAGAPGENTHLLRALVEEGGSLVSYVPLRDAEAAIAAYAAEVGDELSLTLGGKLDQVYNRPLEFSGTLVSTHDTIYGKTAVLRNEGTHVILTELPAAVNTPSYFKDLGLKLMKADVIVVKNLFPFRYNFVAYNRGTLNVETPGTTSVNLWELDYVRIPRPIHPLDKVDQPF